jgi:hypothetical protein
MAEQIFHIRITLPQARIEELHGIHPDMATYVKQLIYRDMGWIRRKHEERRVTLARALLQSEHGSEEQKQITEEYLNLLTAEWENID